MGFHTRNKLVDSVKDGGAAWRAGVRVGDRIRKFKKKPLKKKAIDWEDENTHYLNSRKNPKRVVAIQVWKQGALSNLAQRRRRYIDKQKVSDRQVSELVSSSLFF